MADCGNTARLFVFPVCATGEFAVDTGLTSCRTASHAGHAVDLVKVAVTAVGAAASAGRAGTLFVWPCLAYCESVRCYFLSMKSLHGRSGAFRRGHGDKRETVRPAIGAINREIDLGDVAMNGKQIHKIVVSSGSSQIVHV